MVASTPVTVLAVIQGQFSAGVLSTTPNIQAITIHDKSNYFTVGPLYLTESAPTPEPASALLAAVGPCTVLELGRRMTQS